MGLSKLKLDIGCGIKKREGFIGIDRMRGSSADVYANVERGLPFADNSVAEVWMNHVFEHVNNPVDVMDEIWRVCMDGARVELRGPHFSMPALIWGDPTHKRGLSIGIAQYFNGTWVGSKAHYDLQECFLRKGNTSFAESGLRIWWWPFVILNKAIEAVVNVSPAWIARYERFGSRYVGFQEIQFVLTARKSEPNGPCGATANF